MNIMLLEFCSRNNVLGMYFQEYHGCINNKLDISISNFIMDVIVNKKKRILRMSHL